MMGLSTRMTRDAREKVDPSKALSWLIEDERTADRGVVRSLTVFLVGAECPFGCVFCDLWRYTLETATPAGALTHQLRQALAATGPGATQIKLYNASNFFDSRAVPPGEEDLLLPLLTPFTRVVVECHPKLVGQRCDAFAQALGGRLEVAMGLETIHPEALPRLGKSMTLTDFRRACQRLHAQGVATRAFVLVGAPYVPAGEAVDWAVRSAEWAFEQGVGLVSLIPVRGRSAGLAELARAGLFSPPRLEMLEQALERCLALGGGAVSADLWDLDLFASCADCMPARSARLARMNLTGVPEPAIPCPSCPPRR